MCGKEQSASRRAFRSEPLVADPEQSDRQRHRGGPVREEGYTHIPASPGLPIMLISKRPKPIRRKVDWYSPKVRRHFDSPLSREDAERLVTDPVAVARHPFLPLIAFPKKERRYRRKPGSATPTVTTKVRELAYPANRDGHILAFYAEQLGCLYEAELRARGLENVVIAYRRGCSNKQLALSAFSEIQSRGACVAIALDIKGFFDNIDHGVLKQHWAGLLGVSRLPDDHFHVYEALTRAGKIDRAELLGRLGFPPNARDRSLPRVLCSVARFRALRKAGPGTSKLVHRPTAKRGIPQGTPLSGMAANLAMLGFDTAIQAAVSAVGASYRRYSDDILITCSPEHADALEAKVTSALSIYTKTLTLNSDKRELARFVMPGAVLVAIPPRLIPKPLQYLGFTFDGQRVLIRDGTLSRYFRRSASGVKAVKAHAGLARNGKLAGRPTAHRRELLAKYTHLGLENFVSGYAKQAATIMKPLGSTPIRRQLSRHMKVLRRRLAP